MAAANVVLTYKTRFADGEGVETFVYGARARPRLIGYHIASTVPIPGVNAPAVRAAGGRQAGSGGGGRGRRSRS
jgi:hypothetical protein